MSLHDDIMNIPHDYDEHEDMNFHHGFACAKRDAAELALKADADNERLTKKVHLFKSAAEELTAAFESEEGYERYTRLRLAIESTRDALKQVNVME